jgi:hypothetical protein
MGLFGKNLIEYQKLKERKSANNSPLKDEIGGFA